MNEAKVQESADQRIAVGDPNRNGAEKAKRKRGRPRQSDTTTETLDKEAQPAEEPKVDGGSAPSARCRGRDQSSGRLITHGESHDQSKIRQDGALREVDQNARAPSERGNLGEDSEIDSLAKNSQPIEEQAGRKTSQNEASSAQAGQMLYRVGLSKRSRIAPLLKSLRK